MAKIAEFTGRLDKCRFLGEGRWLACCPAHADRSPSLAVFYDSAKDKMLIKCFAECSVDDIVSAVGMTLADLMPERIYDGKWERPRLNKIELFDKLFHESKIMRCVVEDLLTGKPVNVDSKLRALEACKIISNISDEIGAYSLAKASFRPKFK